MHLLTLTTASYSCTQQSMQQTIIDMVKETLRCRLIDLDEQKFGFITLQIDEYFQNKFVLSNRCCYTEQSNAYDIDL